MSNNIGNALLQVIQRPADWATIVLVVFSILKAKNVLQFVRILFPLAVLGLVLAAVPAGVVFLVTNGDTRLLNLGLVGGWADRIAVSFDFLIPCFLIVVPSLLHWRVPWKHSLPDARVVFSTWLAIYAAVATVGLVITLHFVKGGQLAKMRPTIVIAAIVGVVFLILPLYNLLARACWECGYRSVYSKWWTKQKETWKYIWQTVIHGAPADSGMPDYLGDLLAALMVRHFDPDRPIPPAMLAKLREATQLDTATDTGPTEPAAVPLDKLLKELGDTVQVNAPGG